MIIKTIKYEDYTGAEIEEDFRFHLTKVELTELEMKYKGGFGTHINKLVSAGDNAGVFRVLQDIVDKAYGVLDEGDVRKFRKSRQSLEDFKASEAYSNLLIELLSDPDKAASFFTGVMPKDLQQQVESSANQKVEGREELLRKFRERNDSK